VEFTAEKFMDRGMYFLSTLSLYESKYKGSDGIWRDNAFNSNYVFNFLGGKEFRVGKKKKDARYIKKLVIDGKVNWAGGQRYTPIDLEASRKAGAAVYVTEEAYARQLPQYFRLDARVGYKWIGNKTTQEIALDIRNLTNRMNPFYIRYNSNTGEIEKKGFGMTPELLYRIRF
jgi:outer membrane receptor protein involved in Fe transport